jgi:hypothetical protein
MNKVYYSPEFARQVMRRALSECSLIAKTLIEVKEIRPTTEALQWIRLSRIFWAEDEIWCVADVVGLVSRSGCRKLQNLFLSGIDAEFPVQRDKNNLC